MRLRRLDLTRFGHFTNYSIDFGSLEEGKPDLHVIFGPNEAGKSTAFEGYLDLLFGIPKRSSYNFLHDYNSMLVGGVLEIDGVPAELLRIKKDRNDLLDGQGNTVNPAMLHRVLGGMEREQYRAMFSLNDETIEAGGEDILESQGDLGELLFAASAGLSELGGVLDQVRTDIHEFHKPRAHKTILSDAKKNIERIESEIKKLDTHAGTFRTWVKAEKEAREKYEAVKAERNHLLKEKSLVEATLECLPLLPGLAAMHEESDGLKDFSSIPNNVVSDVERLQHRSEQAQRDKVDASSRCLELNGELELVERDPAIMGIEDGLELLLDVPKSRAQTASADLPDRQLELRILDEKINHGFDQLNFGGNPPEAVAEPALRQIEELANDWADKQHDLENAQKEKNTTSDKLNGLYETNHLTEYCVETHVVDIEQLLDRIRPEDLIAKLESAQKVVQAAMQKVGAGVKALLPWVGEVDHLPVDGCTLTEDQARRLLVRWESLHDALDKTRDALDEAILNVDQRSAWITEVSSNQNLVSDSEASVIRSKRDALWHDHVARMNADTADTFHHAMMQCDNVQDARLAAADRLARLREKQSDKTEFEARKNHFQHKMTDIQQQMDTERKIIAAHLEALCLPESFDILDLPAWLKKLSAVRADVEALNRESADLAHIKQEVADAERTLRDALAINAELALPQLAPLARKRVATVVQIKTVAAELIGREKAIAGLRKELATIQTAWQEQLSVLPVVFNTPSAFRAALPTLREINGWITQRNDLVQRISAMEKDEANFAIQIREYARMVGAAEDAQPLLLARQLEAKLKNAVLAENLYQRLSEELKKATAKQIKAENELTAVAAEILETARHFPVSTGIEAIADLVAAVDKSRKADSLRLACQELENRIVTRLGKPSIEAALAFLSDKEIPEMQAKLETLRKDCEQTEKDYEQAIGDYRSASDKLKRIGGDDAVVRLTEERQTAMLIVADQAKQNLRLRLGLIAAEQALLRYREKHRSSMLVDTAKAFQTLTGGRYSDLQTQPAGQKEILLALRAHDKRSISVTDMSKGTRFQLYLALRLAGYRQFVSGGTVLPFVADDIMETFDNTRTAAALELLRQMALNGQALYFTHHEHVVELARKHCGDSVTIHHLASRR